MTNIDDLPDKDPDEPRPDDGHKDDDTNGHEEQQYPDAEQETGDELQGAGSGEPDQVNDDPENQAAAEQIRDSTIDEP